MITLLQLSESSGFEGTWFQPLYKNLLIWDKKYTFWLPFNYFTTQEWKRKIQIKMSQVLLVFFPSFHLLSEVKWTFTIYNLILELKKKYSTNTVQRILMNQYQWFLKEGYLIEHKANENRQIQWVDLFDKYFWDETFESLTSETTDLFSKESKRSERIEVIDKEEFKNTRKNLWITDLWLLWISDLKNILIKEGYSKDVRNLTSENSKSYYLQILTNWVTLKIQLGRDLTNTEKEEIVKKSNDLIDQLITLAKI